MRRLFAGIVAGFMLAASAGPLAAADAVFAGEGTVGLVPPAGMVPASGVHGFEDRAAKASILIVEMPPSAFGEILSGFDTDALATKGVVVEHREDLTLGDGSKALLLRGRQQVGGLSLRKWVLLGGGKSTTALVTAQYPDAAAATYPDTAIEAALRSVVFRAPPTTDELVARLPFAVPAIDGYRPLKVLGNAAVMMAKGPADQIEGFQQPVFIVAAAQGDIREEDRDSFSRRAIASVPGVKNIKPERGGPLRIGGQPGFEIVASAEDAKTGAPVKVAQWLRFGKSAYIRMVGVARADGFDTAFTEMRGLRDGVTLR
ncbi:hypothetical protein [Ancylobacter terrae]|uniref:hypothetical protein n=1 Tax=Ancylobacter sp. sgz301288 TaxID=3342077 RepID=UPI00385D6010